MQPILQGRRAKIDEEADFQVQEAEIGQHLLGMDGRQPLQRLDLDHNKGFDDQIDPESVMEMKAIA